ncbi:MAG: hypothetical protein JWR67_2478 [Mucilaginibacter sp.]|jgi:hypothetical protein|nr:hypothetical protein [Mucilaginibacter sp.]MDB5111364.1 hypothetical protein [Mucilaginibacter sp.]
MEAPKETTHPPFMDQLKEYAETRLKLAKYKAIDSGSSIIASIITDLVVVISMVFVFVFASFTLAFYLSKVIGSYWEGFGCVALLYLLIAVIFIVNKAGFEKPIANAFIQKFFKD